ncbi:ABC-three component system middle component 6 [Streptomyces sp. NPDC006459]|uniref:ABC-three component system middle component 6 n=1 Tax=Streptomyces sp. NPDC006459 TaxID=3154303 RepID=UPI0033B4DB4E
MIAPSKYVSTSNSLLGQASVILSIRKPDSTVSALWDDVRRSGVDISYERFILCLDFLYTVGMLDLSEGTLSWRG